MVGSERPAPPGWRGRVSFSSERPSGRVDLIGITGTSGKTTTS